MYISILLILPTNKILFYFIFFKLYLYLLIDVQKFLSFLFFMFEFLTAVKELYICRHTNIKKNNDRGLYFETALKITQYL